MWLVIRSSRDESLHVVPHEDLVGHDLHDECVCGPSFHVDASVSMDGKAVADCEPLVLEHHALDGRHEAS